MYRKEWLPMPPGGEPGETDLLYYSMNSTGIMPPSREYLQGIVQGYRDFELDLGPLDAAVKDSWDRKAPSHIERQRTRRTGRPELQRAPLRDVSSSSSSRRDPRDDGPRRYADDPSSDFGASTSSDGWLFPDDYHDSPYIHVARRVRRRR
jgi:hypothetical protein